MDTLVINLSRDVYESISYRDGGGESNTGDWIYINTVNSEIPGHFLVKKVRAVYLRPEVEAELVIACYKSQVLKIAKNIASIAKKHNAREILFNPEFAGTYSSLKWEILASPPLKKTIESKNIEIIS